MAWWILCLYCSIVFFLSISCVAASSSPQQVGWQKTIAKFTYRPAVFFGKARLLYSIVFLFGVFSFYSVQSSQAVVLVVFWGLFMAVWPLGLPELLSSFASPRGPAEAIGQVIRTDSPNVVRVQLNPNCTWDVTAPKLYQQADGR